MYRDLRRDPRLLNTKSEMCMKIEAYVDHTGDAAVALVQVWHVLLQQQDQVPGGVAHEDVGAAPEECAL